MSMTKRLFDIIVALAIVILLLPLIAFVSLLILLRDGRPVFYVSERMKAPEQGFALLKFRTMHPDNKDMGATGAHKNNRITKTGLVLRRSRIDEIPQLWNILVGDMSFVGPRPPFRRFVEKLPELYCRVLHYRSGKGSSGKDHSRKVGLFLTPRLIPSGRYRTGLVSSIFHTKLQKITTGYCRRWKFMTSDTV